MKIFDWLFGKKDQEEWRHHYSQCATDYNNILGVVLEMQTKMGILCDAMGVVISATENGKEPKLTVVREDAKLADGRSYLEVMAMIDKVQSMHFQVMKSQARMYHELELERGRARAAIR